MRTNQGDEVIYGFIYLRFRINESKIFTHDSETAIIPLRSE